MKYLLIVFCLFGFNNLYSQNGSAKLERTESTVQQQQIQGLESQINYWKMRYYEEHEKLELAKTSLQVFGLELRNDFQVFITQPEIATVIDSVLKRIVPVEVRTKTNLWVWNEQLKEAKKKE